ncbi:MAG TPA: methyltransferase domain-containing protein, partial [Dehalococcoidia bacterium]|nr:methyltransferase domain-containing protein [Dehalococcoidia bacterium]
RIVGPRHRTIHNRIAASYRGQEFYDGDRANGYGGMVNDGRWGPIAAGIVNRYGAYRRVLQVGAHKGFLLKELYDRGCMVRGQEVSQYAAEHSVVRLDISPFTALPYEDGEFDLVIAASAVYTLNLPDAIKCLREIERVKRPGGHSFVTLGAMEDESDIDGLRLLRYWFLLGTTILTKSDWLAVMEHAGYTGDYRFDTAKYLKLQEGN